MSTVADTTIVFTTLAMNQTLFFEALARSLAAQGFRTAHICFHERSHEYLLRQGMRSFNGFECAIDETDIDWDAFGIANPAYLLSHEKAAYELTDTRRLLGKFERYLRAVSACIDALAREDRQLIVVQELGGFTSILATFHVARSRGIHHWFIEPSFFRGRVLLVPDSLRALPIAGPSGRAAGAEVTAYLETALQQQTTVIPLKDAHHYRSAWRKLADGRHIRRAVEKAADKYLLGKREEFAHIAGHVWRHVRMALRSGLLRRHYRQLEGQAPFVYYPLHVPADVSITLRAAQFLDQLALIDYLCRITPHPYKVAIKEHPALVGAIGYGRLKSLLEARDNLILLDAGINNYRVLEQASAIVTINSKAGAEALLLGKPVLVLGDAFYRSCTLVRQVDRAQDLEPKLREVLGSPAPVAHQDVLGYFQDVWDSSFPGELYVTDAKNIAVFAASLTAGLQLDATTDCGLVTD